jgi:aminopeptidase N
MSPKDYLFDPNSKAMNRLDYRPSEYLIPKTDLHFDLDDTATLVKSKLEITRNPDVKDAGGPLILNGEAMKLISIKVNGQDLDRADYVVTDKELIIKRPPTGDFTLEIENEIDPTANTMLEGLYKTDGLLSTQCEAHGFRRITYFLDRPDVMSSFSVTLEGDKKKYPILLANGNGNPFQTKDLGNGRHQIKWDDPHLKPSYLFAIVAGDLKYIEDTFTTMSGKDVTLRIFVEDGYENQIDWGMESIKRSMKWDEDAYGREYDLDVFHIVAVKSFNMGAMENKGLNIFNISILAGDPERTTDARLIAIEAVIGHEYFHNWSGNRVTVRDWFELTLKEGLTVLRDRQFTSAMHSEAIKNIEDAIDMETYQFIEDGGPSAHPIRPDFVQEFDNIYSGTIYEKGSHVLGMMKTLMGDQTWRKAMDEYFSRFDGQAVTCDDFVDVMQEVSGLDLTQFRKWYSQSGTPEIDFKGSYDAASKKYTLTLKQNTPPTPDQDKKEALYMPIAIGLIGQNGKDVDLGNGETTKILHLKDAEQTFTFDNVDGPVVPSILRGFSAPVKIVADISDDDLIFRMANDTDGYNRYAASNVLIKKTILKMADDISEGKEPSIDKKVLDAYDAILTKAMDGDKSLTALLLSMPTMGELSALKVRTGKADPLAMDNALDVFKKKVFETHKTHFETVFDTTKAPANETYEVSPEQVGRRALHNRALGYIGSAEDKNAVAKAKEQFESATNMTERVAALSILSQIETPEAEKAFEAFYKKFKNDTNVLDAYLMLQAGMSHGDILGRVKKLMEHEAFDIKTPNKVRAVLGGFMRNAKGFHNKDGSGYTFLADQIIALNTINPRIGSGLIKPFLEWNKYTEPHSSLMKSEIERILKTPDLAMGIKELAQKALKIDDGKNGKPGNDMKVAV